MAPLYAYWRDRARSMNLRRAWEGTVPEDDLMVIGAGERGDLAETLRFLSKVVTVSEKNRSAVIGAIAFPAFLLLLTAGIQIGIAIGMMPIMTQIIPVEQFPFLGKILYYMSQMVLHYWAPMYGLPVALALAFFISLPRWTGRAREYLDHFAPYSIYRDLRASEFLVALAAMASANTSMFDAVSLMMQGAEPWLRMHLARIRHSLRSERSMVRAVDTGLFSNEVFDRIAEYAERSNFEKGIRKIGLATIEETAERISKRSQIIRNILVVMVGLLIMLTVAAMLQIGHEAGEQAQRMM